MFSSETHDPIEFELRQRVRELETALALATKGHAGDISAAKCSGYVAAVGALHNAIPIPFVETDTDKIIGRVAALVGELDHDLRIETERARRAEAERDELLTFLRTHGPDIMLYLKPQVEGLKRPCRDALGKVLERFAK